MKRINLISVFILLAALAVISPGTARAQENTRTLRTTPDVSISLCIEAGEVTVTSWERDEVEARTSSGVTIELRANEATTDASPASSVEVILRSENASSGRARCGETANTELKIPRGATIEINTRHARVNASGMAEARIETISGEINLRLVSRRTEAKTVSGRIHIEDARGSVSARTITGAISVRNASANTETDALSLQAVGGEISIDRIAYRTVAAASVLGNVETTSELASEGRYNFQSSSGDIIFNLPTDSSFRLSASVARSGTIITDFPIRRNEEGDAPRSRAAVRRLAGTHGNGAGAAELNLVSNSGTIYLRRR